MKPQPPVRVATCSAGERLQILELCLLNLLLKGGSTKNELAAKLDECLKKHGAMNIAKWGSSTTHNTFPVWSIVRNLDDAGFISGAHVTPKGRRYLRECSKRVRVAAVKISCDVLDQIAEVIR